MHVLHVMASGARGGGAEHLLGLLPALRARGIQCSAAVGSDGPLGPRLKEAGLSTRELGLMAHRFSARAARQLRQTLADEAADVIHFHGTRGAFYGMWAAARPAWLRRRPFVYTVHGLSYRKAMGWRATVMYLGVEAMICRRARRVISVSRRDLDELIQRRFLKSAQGHHIPNCVRASLFDSVPRSYCRQALGLPQDGFVVGTVARLVPQKSVGDLVTAVVALPGVSLVVAGDGPNRAALEAQGKRAPGRVHFLGARDDIPTILGALDLFVLPSRWEGEPIALLEAMAAGRACVATATEGAQEVIREGTGMLVPIGSVEGIRTAVQRLREDAALRVALGRAARTAMAGRRFEAAAARHATVYADLVAEPLR